MTANPPTALYFLGINMDLYSWGHSFSCVRLSSHLNPSFSQYTDVNVVFFYCLLNFMCFVLDSPAMINAPLYLNDDLFLI